MEEKDKDLYELKLEMLKDAIKDTQSIISMLDLKARFLLAVNLAIIAGILLIMRQILTFPISDNEFLCTFIMETFSIFIITYNIIIIYKLIYYIINPRNNPLKQISNVDPKYKESPFFPIPENNCFDFSKFKNKLENFSEDDIKNIYILELLKISYIRHTKLVNLNEIIYKHFKYLIVLLVIFFLFLLVFIVFILKD